jgi:site-specific DNA recombinase
MTTARTGREPGATRAILYLRVSTKEQAQKGGEAQGYSIPAQRIAGQRKAESLGAIVVAEFVDAGESARSAARPELQRMLEYVKANPVDYVIVHKVDRLARNRADDLHISLALQSAGVVLVSCSENIDETPSGVLLHAIMSGIAEFYSRNLANEVMKGLVQKARNGGTPGRAPLGYLNVRKVENGQEIRTIEVDPERAPLIKWAYEAYATGEWTQLGLLEELTARGLELLATRRVPAKPLSLSYIQYMLTNPYYKGVVRYQGVDYDGRHEPLVSTETWQRVQDILAAKNAIREKERTHPHYLKGILCGNCGSRLIVTHAKSRSGRIYPYFVCVGRHQKRTNCTLKAILIERVEELVERHYAKVQLPRDLRQAIETVLREELDRHYEEARRRRKKLERRRRQLLDQRAKLLQAHYADALPLDLLKAEQHRIGGELARIDDRMSESDNQQAVVEDNLRRALDLASDCRAAYAAAPSALRRQLNQAFFKALSIDDDDVIRSEFSAPFDVIVGDETRGLTEEANRPVPVAHEPDWRAWKASFGETKPGPKRGPGLKQESLVGAPGIEPGTSCV